MGLITKGLSVDDFFYQLTSEDRKTTFEIDPADYKAKSQNLLQLSFEFMSIAARAVSGEIKVESYEHHILDTYNTLFFIAHPKIRLVVEYLEFDLNEVQRYFYREIVVLYFAFFFLAKTPQGRRNIIQLLEKSVSLLSPKSRQWYLDTLYTLYVSMEKMIN